MTDAPAITALKPLPSDPTRVSVRVGRKRVATLSADDARTLQLAVGTPWSDELAERVAAVAARQQAVHDAFRIVRRRSIGTEELRRKLIQKRHRPDHAADAIERLTRAGYLDDHAYAESLVRRELARKPAGPHLLRVKLRRKALPPDIIQAVLNDIEDDDATDHVAAAAQLARKKLDTPTMQRADPATRHRRLTSLLARRGFSPDTIRQALDRIDDAADADT